MNKIIYLDTNILLHYQPFTQINWLDIVKAETVTIVIPPITIRELNKHKDTHPQIQIKKRASKIIKTLSNFLDIGTTTKIREGILISFEDREPNIEFSTHQLNPIIQDDQLIASILFNKEEDPGNNFVLVTSDLGLALVAKAGRQDIATMKMPEKYRISDKPDPNEIKVKQLKQQIHDLETRIPIISLVYENGKQHETYKLNLPISLSEQEVETKLDEIQKEYPKLPKDYTKEKTHSVDHSELLSEIVIISQYSQKEINRYNEELEDYLNSYVKYIKNKNKFDNLQNRTLNLKIFLTNNGTVPADDIDIKLYFPGEFQLINEYEFSPPPTPPTPPKEPLTELERLATSLDYNRLISPLSYNDFPVISPKNSERISNPSIKKVNGYEVFIHVEKIKHNIQLALDPLVVIFSNCESAKSFTIDYHIFAANIPETTIGSLNVILENEINN